MVDEQVGFMREIDREYRERSGLTERRFYSIFYSRIDPSPLMILGINPGGNPAAWAMPPGTDEFCTRWQHDYVDERYPIQAAMLPLLVSTLGIEPDLVRRIPKTNMVFRRSASMRDFQAQQGGMTMKAAQSEAHPVLQKIIQAVSPRAIIFEGQDALKRFEQSFATRPLSPSLVPPVTTPNGRHRALVYGVHEIHTSLFPGSLLAVMLAHPSKYASRTEFAVARDDMCQRLARIGEELRRLGPPQL